MQRRVSLGHTRCQTHSLLRQAAALVSPVNTSLNWSSPRKPPAMYIGMAHSQTSGARVSVIPSLCADVTIACCAMVDKPLSNAGCGISGFLSLFTSTLCRQQWYLAC